MSRRTPPRTRRRDRFERGMVVRELPGPGPAVVWLHGLGESGLCFEAVLAEPSLAGWTHLVPDLPGYGRSPWVDRALSLEQLADHVAGWLLEAELAPARLVGHSMGGVLALLVAERSPQAVQVVVDVDGNVSPGDCTFSGRAAAEGVAGFLAGGFDRLRDSVHQAGADDPALRRYWVSLQLADPLAFHRNSLDLVRLSAREDLARRQAALAPPSCYLAGHPGGACARSLELLGAAGVRVQLVEPAGHWPFIDRPREVAARLNSFLDEHAVD